MHELVRGLARALHTAKQRLHARNEHTGAVRLGNEIVRAHGHAHDLVDLGHTRGENDDGDIGLLAQLAADELAVRTGQGEVEQHEVGSGGEDIVDHAIEREAVGHLETLALEHLDDLVANGCVVLDHEYARHSPVAFLFIPWRPL